MSLNTFRKMATVPPKTVSGMIRPLQMQVDLDQYLIQYNQKRPYQGRNMGGKIPYTAFKAGLPEQSKKGAKQAVQKTA